MRIYGTTWASMKPLDRPVGLTPPLLNALRAVARPTLLKQQITPQARERLIELGYIERIAGGLVATTTGRLYLAARVARRKRKGLWRPGE